MPGSTSLAATAAGPITDEASPFRITQISRDDSSGDVTIVSESWSDHLYEVYGGESDPLDGAILTTVIGDDGTTTFVHHLGAAARQQFYHVKRLTFSGDEDGDGVSNIDEYRQGSDINDPNSPPPSPTATPASPTPSPTPATPTPTPDTPTPTPATPTPTPDTPTPTPVPTPTPATPTPGPGTPTPTPATPTPTPDSPTPTPTTPAPTAVPVPSPTAPCGVFALLTANQSPGSDTLNNPNVDGISVRYHWADLEPSKGSYNFVGGLDDIIQACANAGKMVILRVGTGGGDAQDATPGDEPGSKPHWLIQEIQSSGNSDDQFFQFIDGSDGVANLPLYWSSTLLAEKKKLIQDLGARYSSWPLLSDGTPVVKAFALGTANALSDDWNIPDSTAVDGLPPANSTQKSRWLSADFSSQKIINISSPAAPDQSGLIDTAAAAFPNQVVVMAFNPGGWNIDNPNHQTNQQWMPAQIIANARAKYGTRFVAAKNGLNAKQGTTFPSGKNFDLLWANPPCGVQDLWFVRGDQNYRMNGGVADNIHTIYGKATDSAIAIGVKYRETYELDVDFNWTQLPNADGTLPGRDEIKTLHDRLLAACAATPAPSPTATAGEAARSQTAKAKPAWPANPGE